MTAVVIIPARYDSTRFPGKLLYPLKGKPIIQYVYENSKQSDLAQDVIIATDSRTILNEVNAFGGKAVMTDIKHPSGTDRIAEVAASLNYDIIVNVQADEPLIRPEMIDEVITLLEDSRASIGTLANKIDNWEEILDPNTVKVIFDKDWFAIYFSRAPIPYHRDEWRNLSEIQNSKFKIQKIYKHIGIYSYRKDILLSLTKMKQTPLEKIEKLEQLRAIETGLKIKIKETIFKTHGVDTPEDLERVEKCLNTSL
ncbi:MAG: 3-deoxy-manno-octulosonate cytidylyltransferase [Nitrospirae bacterium]|nr:3-deoxy-manno-octulosonate cytidylyltransferase [Nitrospirota bacterium]